MSSTHSVAARDERLDRVGELEVAQVLGQRAGVDAHAQRRPVALGHRDDLGGLLGAADVAGVDAHAVRAGLDRLDRERVVEVDVGDHGDRRVARRSSSAPRRPARAARRRGRCRRRPRRRAGSGPSSGRGSPSRSWSSSARPRARRPRWGRRPRGSAARRPCPQCTRRAGARSHRPNGGFTGARRVACAPSGDYVR